MPALVITALCAGCGACVLVCPHGAIEVVAKVAKVNAQLCRECEECLFSCPQGAITMT